MELFQVELTGFKKFKDKATLKTRGKIVAILGPNEAGKSSLLRALSLLDVNEAYAPYERSKGLDEESPMVKATYLISDEDRKEAGIDVGTWYDVIKRPDGKRSWKIRPSPPDRDYSHRSRLLATLKKLPKSAVNSVTLSDDGLYAHSIDVLERLFSSSNELSSDEKQELQSIASRWQVASIDEFQRVREFSKSFDAAVQAEVAKSQRSIAGELLFSRLPQFVLFGAEDRDLKPTYALSELAVTVPKALANLAKMAELDLPKWVQVASSNPNDPEIDTMIERAKEALERNFQAAWKQSKVSVVLAHRDQTLLVQVYNNDRSRSDFAQRSDGLRQFVALSCFANSRETSDFVLLIDEVEQHLHYDAQADLVQMLAGQTVASKVIYTTHSLGCLPEDLGNGVRLVIPTERASDWSTIENKFWMTRDKNEAAFSPILMAMGASTMAFFPTRAAVLVEGPADAILLPTIFREALNKPTLGVQFVHGLSEKGTVCLPLLNSSGTQVCYVLDSDAGGKKIAEQLKEQNVTPDRIFHWPSHNAGSELEDFIDPSLISEAVSNLASRHYETQGLITAKNLPKYGKWRAIEDACKDANLKTIQKVPIAYEILDILESSPDRRIIDPKHVGAVTSFAEKILNKVQAR